MLGPERHGLWGKLGQCQVVEVLHHHFGLNLDHFQALRERHGSARIPVEESERWHGSPEPLFAGRVDGCWLPVPGFCMHEWQHGYVRYWIGCDPDLESLWK